MSVKLGVGFAAALLCSAASAADEPKVPTFPPAWSMTVQEGDGWGSYNKDLDGQRYSPLTQINPGNASALVEVCRVQVAAGGSFHDSPLVVNGVMYVATPSDTYAIDPRDCHIKWKSTLPSVAEMYPNTKGVAYMDGRLFRGTRDGRVAALDAETGRLLWSSVVGDYKFAETVTGAPIAWAGLVLVGTSGGDAGVKSRVVALEADNGREVWSFNVIPTEKEFGADTWKDARYRGGGAMWSSLTLDVSTAELFIPVGNPSPMLSPSYRPGANLFTESLLVLDARTGALKWWYQLDPHDDKDYDFVAAPTLYPSVKSQSYVATASKDGYLRVIDRETHKLVFATPVTTIQNEHVRVTREHTQFCPGAVGGVAWNGVAFDPKRRMLVVPAIDLCMKMWSVDQEHRPGEIYYGGSVEPVGPATGWLTAIDSETGAVKWKYHARAPMNAGVTPTASGVTFTGDMAGNFLAFESDTGKVLLEKPVGGAVAGGVVTYQLEGRQYVALTSGNVSRSAWGKAGVPTIVILSLPHDATGSQPSAGTADVERGRTIFQMNCVGCHGSDGTLIAGSSLKNLTSRMTLEAAADRIRNPRPPMPKLFPAPLTEQSVLDVAAYIGTL